MVHSEITKRQAHLISSCWYHSPPIHVPQHVKARPVTSCFNQIRWDILVVHVRCLSSNFHFLSYPFCVYWEVGAGVVVLTAEYVKQGTSMS